MCEYALAVVAQIEGADLSGQQYRSARRILDRAQADGCVTLTIEQALRICETKSSGTMRNHLIALKKAGIITYSIAWDVDIQFTAWPNVERDTRAILHAPRANFDNTRAILHAPHAQDLPVEPEESLTMHTPRARCTPHVQIRAESEDFSTPHVQIRANSPALGGTIGGVGWDLDPIPSSESNQPTNPAPVGRNPEEGNSIDPVEQAHSVALLIAAGVIPANAKRLATTHPFERVQRAVAHWWCHKGVTFQETPGIVVTWLDDWQKAGLPPDLPAAFRRSDLYRRHRTRAQQAADAQVTVHLPQAVHHRQPPKPKAEDPLAALWGEITATLPEGTQVYLHHTHLVSLSDGIAQIVAPAAHLPWLRTQLQRRLVRDFALLEQPVTAVQFVADGQEVAIQEVGHASTP